MDKTANCIEYAPFTLRPGIAEAELLAASDRLQEDLLKVPGFLGRVLLKQGDGAFVDLVFWRRKEDTDRMADFIRESEACHRYFACMHMEEGQDMEAGVAFLERVKGYGPLDIR